MGTIPLVGALVITVGSVLWYFFYAREKVDREGAATDVVRRSVGRKAVERTKSAFDDVAGYEVLVAITENTSEERERSLLRIAADVARQNDGSVTVVQFDEVPDQATLEHASETQSPADVEFERQTEELTAEFDVPIRYGEIVSHDAERAIVNFADHEDPDFLLLARRDDPSTRPCSAPASSGSPATRRATSSSSRTGTSTAYTRSPSSPTTARSTQRRSLSRTRWRPRPALESTCSTRSRGTATDAQRETITEYLAELEALCSVPVHREIVDSEDPSRDIVSAIDPADLPIIGTDGGPDHRQPVRPPADRIVDAVDCTAIQVHPQGAKRSTILRRLFERFVF